MTDRVSLVLLLALAALAGCGQSSRPAERAIRVPDGGTVDVSADEYSFRPTAVVIEGGRGGDARVKVRLRNLGALAHNLKVYRGDRELGGTSTFPGGMTRQATLTLGPGDYRFLCTVGDHAERGMKGRLTVR